MSIGRIIVLIPSLSLVSVLWAVEPGVGPAPVSPTTTTINSIDPAVMARIGAVVDKAIANGFPDGKGAVFLKGPLVVVADKPQPDSPPQTSPRREQARQNAQVEEDEQHTTTTYEGLHARLSDGSYFVNLCFVQRPGPGIAIRADRLSVIAAGDVHSTIPPIQETDSADLDIYSKLMSGTQAAGMKTVMRWSGLCEHTGFENTGELATLLIRAGVPDAHELIWAEMFRDFGLQSGSADAPLYVNSEEVQEDMQRIYRRTEQSFSKVRGDKPALPMIPDLPLDAYLSRGLARWFSERIARPEAEVPVARAVAGLTAMIGESPTPAQREELRLFAEYAALPATVADDAPVAERLAHWQPAVRPMGMNDEFISHLKAEELLRMGFKPASGPAIVEADRAGLFAALDDRRASSWLDDGTFIYQTNRRVMPHNRGENALRALAVHYGCDPRLLIGRDPFTAWNSAEQSATAAAMQAWFKIHGSEAISDHMQAVVSKMPAGRAAALISHQPEAARPALISAVLGQWRAQPPTGEAAEGLSQMLVLANADPAGVDLIKGWPVTGGNRLILAAWHEMHGDPQPLDALIPDLLKVDNGDLHHQDAQNLLTVLATRPTVARLGLLKAQLAEVGSPGATRILQTLLDGQWLRADDPGLQVLLQDGKRKNGDVAEKAISYSLMAGLLGDRTIISAASIKSQPWGWEIGELRVQNHQENRPAKKTAATSPSPLAEVRWCDIAAHGVVGNSWEYAQNLQEELQFDLHLPVAERDQQIAAIRSALQPGIIAACTAAHLPLPAAAAPAVNDKALF